MHPHFGDTPLIQLLGIKVDYLSAGQVLVLASTAMMVSKLNFAPLNGPLNVGDSRGYVLYT